MHAYDVAALIHQFALAPRVAEVYNLGGGKDNACSILEAFQIATGITGRKMRYQYIDENRTGDHICYYSDLRKMRAHYPQWNVTKPLKTVFEEIVEGWVNRSSLASAPCAS